MTAPRPNILWLMTDEQRCDSLGCYGRPWTRTPHLDRLAREGVVFENALTPAPVCLPARTALLTGRYPAQTGVWHNDDAAQTPVASLLPAFRAAGYDTASFGKQHYARGPDSPAFAVEAGSCLSDHVGYFNYARPADEATHDVVKYRGIYPWIFAGRFPAPAAETAEARVVTAALHWLEQRDPAAPFFLRLSFNGPHTPVVPPAPFDTLIPPAAVALPADTESLPPGSPAWLTRELARCASSDPLSARDRDRLRQCYYGEVAYLDTQFGRLLDALRARGALDHCLVAFVSDHGTHLGDYGLVQKQTFFEPVVNVPFFFCAPGRIRSGARLRTPVGIHSLLPTLLDLAGISAPASTEPLAPSLAPSLRTATEPPAAPIFSELDLQSFAPHLSHRGRLVMVRDGDWKLSACVDPAIHDVTLHNLHRDPHERQNLAADPSCRARRDTLLRLIADRLRLD